MYSHKKNIIYSGAETGKAKAGLILLHGRGASAKDILSLANYFNLTDTRIAAPQATNNSWYPYSFLSPVVQNQPSLDSALELIGEIVAELSKGGIIEEKIFFAGFSQGACLTLEYCSRNAKKYGGIIAFTGGLIGEQLNQKNYTGDFANTPVLITTGNPDPHVPVHRVKESATIMQALNANVTVKIYDGRPHTILQEEIELASDIFLNTLNEKLN